MSELIKINYDSEQPLVSARDLHTFSELQERYSKWFERMAEYGFSEGVDYTPYQMVHPRNHQEMIDHHLTVEIAKEISMLQRTDKGNQARQYFLALEKAWNTPEAVMARALKMANTTLDGLRGQVVTLAAANSDLAVHNAIMAPKADYFDELVDHNLLTNFCETAKQLDVPPQAFVEFLLDKMYVYRDQRAKLMPYAQHVDNGLFAVKETMNEKTQWSGTQTLITPKGRETFRLLYIRSG